MSAIAMFQQLRVNSVTILRWPYPPAANSFRPIRTYGEDELAARILTLSEAEMRRIGEVADRSFTRPKSPHF